MTAGSGGCIHHGRAAGADKGHATNRQRIEQRIGAEFVERGEPIPASEMLSVLVGREMTEAARAKARDPIRVLKISRAVQERQRLERRSGRLDEWSRNRVLDQSVRFLEKFVAAHPEREEAQARNYLARFQKASKRGSGAAAILTEFRRDRELYGRVFGEGLSSHGWQAHRGERYKAGSDQYVALLWSEYAFTGARRPGKGRVKVLPRLRDLIRSPKTGRPAKQGIPEEFRTRWGFKLLIAVVYGLLQSGLAGVEIAPLFGWEVRYHHGHHSPMVTSFSKIAAKMEDSWRFRAEWEQLLQAAEPYVQKLLPTKTPA